MPVCTEVQKFVGDKGVTERLVVETRKRSMQIFMYKWMKDEENFRSLLYFRD